MRSVLVADGTWSAVNPEVPVPPDDDDNAEYKAYVKKNELALAQIALDVELFHVQTVGRATSARELWTQFSTTYQAKRRARQALLSFSASR